MTPAFLLTILSLLLAVVLGGAAALEAAPTKVAFANIAGARIDAGDWWQLALGVPSDAGVLTTTADIRLAPGRAQTLVPDIPPFLRNHVFTVLLKADELKGGLLTLESPAAPGDRRTTMVARDGWVTIVFGPVLATGAVPIMVTSSAPLRITQATLYRTFDQLFGQFGQVTLNDAVYWKFGAGELRSYPLMPGAYRDTKGQLVELPKAVNDGIPCVVLNKSYLTPIVGPHQMDIGLPVPVRSPGGVILCSRIKGAFAWNVYYESGQTRLEYLGKAGAWTLGGIALDGALMDSSGNGVYTGCHTQPWNEGNTWVDNYLTGKVDFLALLPQNSIPITPAGTMDFSLTYQSTNGIRTLKAVIPANATAVALVHTGDCTTQIRSIAGTNAVPVATIKDSAWPDRLAVEAESIYIGK